MIRHHEIFLAPPFSELWKDADPFAEAAALEGEEFRKVKSRRTFRFEVEGRGFFAKIHHGVGWREIFKNLFQFKLAVLGAANEFYALKKLHTLGVDTMTAAAYGSKGINPAVRESFLITEELKNMVTLEDLGRTALPGAVRRRLIKLVAESAGRMHASGINHRDCYICHYLTCKETLSMPGKVFVIDLHRAQLRRQIPYRYHIKDVAGLHFSSMDAGLSRQDRLRFISCYCRNFPALRNNKKFWCDVERTAVKLYKKEHGR